MVDWESAETSYYKCYWELAGGGDASFARPRAELAKIKRLEGCDPHLRVHPSTAHPSNRLNVGFKIVSLSPLTPDLKFDLFYLFFAEAEIAPSPRAPRRTAIAAAPGPA